MRKILDADALVIGAGPAGAATAILLRLAGWRVILVEKTPYPRQKVCGECLSAATLALLDQLGVGGAVQSRAGPELIQVGWMKGVATVIAPLPACMDGPYRFGRALGRDQLDTILVERAMQLGVTIIQPGIVRSVEGGVGSFQCEIELIGQSQAGRSQESIARGASIVIDAHGSWERAPDELQRPTARSPRQGSDLFAFKASFVHATLPHGLLPVLSFDGGYGGLVLADNHRLTVAGCIRRDTLVALRARSPGMTAGVAFEDYLRSSCRGVRQALVGALRPDSWLSVGPLRPHQPLQPEDRCFRVGNAAVETHPLIGEGISMAIQSAFLLSRYLVRQPIHDIDASRALHIQRAYHTTWQSAFARRRLASVLAQVAMRPLLSRSVTELLEIFPLTLTAAARFAGKAAKPVTQLLVPQEAP